MTLENPTQQGFRYQHVKSGGIYEIIATGILEEDRTPVVIDKCGKKNGLIWVRPFAEFNDGRFICID